MTTKTSASKGARRRKSGGAKVALPTKRTASSPFKIVARAAADQELLPVLVAADVYFPDSELAGMPVVRMRGDSMGEAIRDGDFAIIDTTQTEIAQGGIFALFDDNDSMIIMQVTPVHGSQGRRILCTYANPRYPPFELTLGTEARIVGRVAHRFTRHL
jgi:SOS-response transcriptional repressor LexA